LRPSQEQGLEREIEGESGNDATRNGDEDVARDDPEDVAALRAERHADAELVGALRDAVGNDAVEAEESEQESQCGEGSKEDGEETLLTPGGLLFHEVLEVAHVARGLLVGVDGPDGEADIAQSRERSAVGADEELGLHPHDAGTGEVDGGLHGMVGTVIGRIGDHADDLEPSAGIGRADVRRTLSDACPTRVRRGSNQGGVGYFFEDFQGGDFGADHGFRTDQEGLFQGVLAR
jgi:hypothetical protein